MLIINAVPCCKALSRHDITYNVDLKIVYVVLNDVNFSTKNLHLKRVCCWLVNWAIILDWATIAMD